MALKKFFLSNVRNILHIALGNSKMKLLKTNNVSHEGIKKNCTKIV